MSFINSLKLYAKKNKISPNEAYAKTFKTGLGLAEQNIVRKVKTKPGKETFVGLSTRELYLKRPMD